MANNKILILLIVVSLAAGSFCAGVVYGQATVEPKRVYITEYLPVAVIREVEVVKEVKVIKRAEVEVVREVYSPEFREFKSRDELKTWLGTNPVSEREYKPRVYDCDDFAKDLVLDAAKDGYWLGFAVTRNHIACCTIIGNQVIWIEPENDRFAGWGFLD